MLSLASKTAEEKNIQIKCIFTTHRFFVLWLVGTNRLPGRLVPTAGTRPPPLTPSLLWCFVAEHVDWFFPTMIPRINIGICESWTDQSHSSTPKSRTISWAQVFQVWQVPLCCYSDENFTVFPNELQYCVVMATLCCQVQRSKTL